MNRSKQIEAALPPLAPTLNKKLLLLGARIIAGGVGEEEALDILEAVALNQPVQVISARVYGGVA